jgi:hypothetical protein
MKERNHVAGRRGGLDGTLGTWDGREGRKKGEREGGREGTERWSARVGGGGGGGWVTVGVREGK